VPLTSAMLISWLGWSVSEIAECFVIFPEKVPEFEGIVSLPFFGRFVSPTVRSVIPDFAPVKEINPSPHLRRKKAHRLDSCASLVAVNAVGGDLDFANTTKRKQKFYEVLGRLLRGLFDDVPNGVCDRGLKHHAFGLEASKVNAHDLARLEHAQNHPTLSEVQRKRRAQTCSKLFSIVLGLENSPLGWLAVLATLVAIACSPQSANS
jgi:hypothetical protein